MLISSCLNKHVKRNDFSFITPSSLIQKISYGLSSTSYSYPFCNLQNFSAVKFFYSGLIYQLKLAANGNCSGFDKSIIKVEFLTSVTL